MQETEPVSAEAREFRRLADFRARKRIVQELELRIHDGRRRLDEEDRRRCAASEWDLDRIALYVAEENDPGPPDYRTRRIRVEHEGQRLRAAGYEGSLMPLSYALGSFLAMLDRRPHLTEAGAHDRRLFTDLREDLVRHPHLDGGGQVKRDLDAILARLPTPPAGPLSETAKPHPASAAESTAQRPASPTGIGATVKSFFTTLPGILAGAAALITALAGVFIADGGGDAPPPGAAPPILTIERVELFPEMAGAVVQVVADVNGTEFRYPSIGGVEWAEAGPAMSSQQFRLPPSDAGYQLRFRAVLRAEDGRRALETELLSQETAFVAGLPFDGEYLLYPRSGGTRSAAPRAAVVFSVRGGV